MDNIQRDLGRIEATQAIMKEDVKQIKADLAVIKDSINGQTAVRETDWKRLTLMGILATLASQIISWLKPFVT